MYATSFSALALLATVCTASVASPVVASPLEARDDTANVRMFSGDTCNGAEDGFSLTGSGSFRCVPVPSAKRSISVSGRYVILDFTLRKARD